MGRRVGFAPRVTGERIGILGGVFDPIHYGHLAIAEQTREALELDQVLLMPAGQPVHRAAPQASADDRARMIELAVADNDRLLLSRLEIDTDRPSYSVDTLEQLAHDRPGAALTLIVSAEAASYLPTWSRPLRLLELAEVAIVPRLGYADIPREWLDHHFPAHVDRFRFVDATRLGHSSSDIRTRLAEGRTIRYLVPRAVVTYIGEHHLYGSHDRPDA